MHQHFGSYQNIYNAPISELTKYLSPQALDLYLYNKSHKNPFREYEKLALKGISFIPQTDSRFPVKLLDIPNPPIALLVNGSLPNPQKPSVAIIGSRSCSSYGRAVAQEFAEYLSQNGIQIISGMALGIDGIAGRSALKGPTPSHAVLGCGPDICYPQSNADLFDKLIERGGIISEYALGTPAIPWHFPLRNRIISGLSDAVIVIEAKEKSGTLITVDTALEQGRDVFALPGRIHDKLSLGCNQLIKQGAGILTTPQDFLADFLSINSNKHEYTNYMKNFKIQPSALDKPLPSFSSPEDKIIYESLNSTPQSLDQICLTVNQTIPMPLTNIMVRIISMAMAGLISSENGNYFI